jgi:serine/threonine protein kinase
MENLVGKTIKRYKIMKEIGRGGMAVVYQAIDKMLDRRVAVKLILTEDTTRERIDRLLRRFNREAKALASLTHPHIVKILDYGEYESAPFLVMEFIGGGSLKARLGSPIHFVESASLLVPVARALQHAHQKKIIHRDIKPENILINEANQLMVSDFGILKMLDVEESQALTGPGKVIGTYAYMSPEQIRGMVIDGRADVYALGIVFFEMITGQKPYSVGSPIQISMQHLYSPIPKAKQFVRDLSADAELLITTALAKDPADRYSNMNAFAEALENLASTSATAQSRGRTKKKPGSGQIRKWPAYSLFVASLIILVVVLLGLTFLVNPNLGLTVLGLQSNTSTVTPGSAPTNTHLPPSPTQPPPTATRTATPEPLPISTSPAPNVIQPQNAALVFQRNRLTGISVIEMEWIQDGNWLIDAGSQKISFINPETATIEHSHNLPDEIPLSMAVHSASGKVYLLFNDNIKVLEIDTFEVTDVFAPIAGGARSIAVSPDGRSLALGISDNKTQLLNANSGSVVRRYTSNYGGWAVGFSLDSKYVVSGTSQGLLKWEKDSGLWRPMDGGQDKIIKTLAFSHDGKLIAAGSNGVILIWSVEDGQLLRQIEADFGTVNALDFSPDDSLLVSATDDGIVRLWNPASGSLIKALTDHSGAITDACFSPDGQYFASGSAEEASIRIWGLP